MATIKDVARLAGTSETTVSHALSGTRRVSAALQARVRAAAATLNYQPDPGARSLRTGKTNMLGLLLPDITNPWHPHVARAVLDVTTPAGYHTLLCVTDGLVDQEVAFLSELVRRRVDGFVILCFTFEKERLCAALQGVPAVFSTPPEETPSNLDYISFDEVAAARLAVDHLVQRGCRRIATITGPQSLYVGRLRFQGYREGLAAHGLPYDPALVAEGDFWLPSGEQSVVRLLEARPRPDAIFAANDLMALGALGALRQAGITVPDEIALVGFDDIPEAAISSPALTTVRNPAYEVGRLAGTVLLTRLRQPEAERMVVPVDPVLVCRETA